MSAGTLRDILKACFPLLASSNTWIVLSICDSNPEDNLFLKHESISEAWKACKNRCEGRKMWLSLEGMRFYLRTHTLALKKKPSFPLIHVLTCTYLLWERCRRCPHYRGVRAGWSFQHLSGQCTPHRTPVLVAGVLYSTVPGNTKTKQTQ